MTVQAGELIAVSGPSGSGKSTLLRAIADLDPHQGQVYLDDAEQSSMPAHLWRQQVGLLPADSHWWFDTVAPHFPSVNAHWLTQLGFEDEVLKWDVARLSSGERQRLALLRLLCHEPKALLLDEASANLDETNTRRVETIIKDYARERHAPVMWISHDPDQINRIAQRRALISDGRLIVEETPQ